MDAITDYEQGYHDGRTGYKPGPFANKDNYEYLRGHKAGSDARRGLHCSTFWDSVWTDGMRAGADARQLKDADARQLKDRSDW